MKSNRRVLAVLSAIIVASLAACGGGGEGEEDTAAAYPPERVREGESLYQQTCFACHGPDGKGLPNLGKDLTTSEFVKDSSDNELLAFVKVGRGTDDPANTTGVAMPPKGGFDYLTDDDILNIIAYVRSIGE